MNHRRPPLPVIVIALLVISASLYFVVTQTFGDDDGALTASGTIEAAVVNISPEMAGKVHQVAVSEGQSVRAGELLLALDDSLLAAQRLVSQSGADSARSALQVAQSSYAMTQAQYEAALTAARAQQGASRLSDWSSRAPNWFEQPLWYFSRDEQLTAVQAEVDAALEGLQQAQVELERVEKDLNHAEFVAAEERLSNARMGYLIAKSVEDHAQLTGGKVSPEDIQLDVPPFASAYRIKIAVAKTLSGGSDILTAARDAFDAADAELKEAEQAYNDLLDTAAASQVLEARAGVSVAQERYEVALDTRSRLQTGADSPQVRISALGLDQAQASVGQAESAVRQAEASLALLDTQMAKLGVYAPMDGVILTRNVEPGEFVQPGSVAFSMADLEEMTITVFIPEDRYGEISLGEEAQVTVDSFPDETFAAEVVQIADQAEFTPRNVQTVEGRSSTVYAIKLKVTNSDGKLKIGMPADVTFE